MARNRTRKGKGMCRRINEISVVLGCLSHAMINERKADVIGEKMPHASAFERSTECSLHD